MVSSRFDSISSRTALSSSEPIQPTLKLILALKTTQVVLTATYGLLQNDLLPITSAKRLEELIVLILMRYSVGK